MSLPAKLVFVVLVGGAAVWSCGDDEEPPVVDAGIGGEGGTGGATSSSSGEAGAVA